MALSKKVLIDQYEIVGIYKILQCRLATVISEDGIEISRSFHRYNITPVDDLSNESEEIKSIVAAVHTQKIKDAYAEVLAESKV